MFLAWQVAPGPPPSTPTLTRATRRTGCSWTSGQPNPSLDARWPASRRLPLEWSVPGDVCVPVCWCVRALSPSGERPGSITDLRAHPVAALAQGHQPCARGAVGQGRGPCACVLGHAGLLSTPHGVHILIPVLQDVQGGPFLPPLLTSLLEGVGVNKVNRCTNFKRKSKRSQVLPEV